MRLGTLAVLWLIAAPVSSALNGLGFTPLQLVGAGRAGVWAYDRARGWTPDQSGIYIAE